MKGSRAYPYCRVAHDDGFSLELQKEELLRFAERAGFEIVGISAGIDVSIVRFVWLLLCLAGSIGIWLYLICTIAIPKELKRWEKNK